MCGLSPIHKSGCIYTYMWDVCVHIHKMSKTYLSVLNPRIWTQDHVYTCICGIYIYVGYICTCIRNESDTIYVE